MDLFKKLTLASIGAVTLTRERAEELLDELVKKGELTKDEKAEAMKKFVDKSIESTEKMKKWTEETFDRLSGKFAGKFNEQVAQLSSRIDQLNARIAELESKLGKTDKS
jgi:polyhydroxyalkanoate synthesis regulator phasin